MGVLQGEDFLWIFGICCDRVAISWDLILWYNLPMEKLDRKERVRQAIANERLEALSVSRATRRTLNDYATGKISAEEAAEQVFSRYGVR